MPSGSMIARDGLDRQPRQHLRRASCPAMPLAPSRTTFSGAIAETSTMLSTFSVKPSSTGSEPRSPGAAGVLKSPASGDRPHLVEAGVAADRQHAAAHDLHAVVLGRVVRRGDGDAALVAVLADGVVHHLGAARGRCRRRRSRRRGRRGWPPRTARATTAACRGRRRCASARSGRRRRGRCGRRRRRRARRGPRRGRRTP